MNALKDHYFGDTPFVPYQPHSETSREAAQAISKHIGPMHERVLSYLRRHPEGATDNALCEALDLKGSTLRPRRIELVEAGLVVDSGRYHRDDDSKRKSTVWISL